jgi:diaminopimelate decarboxylase
MHHFHYQHRALHAENVPLERIANAVGTPTYIYSAATLRRHYRVMDEAFGERSHLVCYSVKANSTLGVLALLAREGSGFDIVSGGELFRALAANASPGRIVYSGVGKTREEIAFALEQGILAFNVESEDELSAIAAIARRRRVKAPVTLRVNPGIGARTHRHIDTGRSHTKFGIPLARAASLYRRHRKTAGLRFVGVDCHIGSQMTELGPLTRAVKEAAALYRTLLAEGFPLGLLDVGGGLGITYIREQPPEPREYAAAIARAAGDLPARLVVEPGRVVVGNAGLLLTRVIYRKEGVGRRFAIVDAGMNDLIRPALYEARHDIVPVVKGGRSRPFDVVGPICESADVFARDVPLPKLEPGDLLAVMSAGAYGMSMASNYNSRPRPAEVLVDGDRYDVIRDREDYDDLVRGEGYAPASPPSEEALDPSARGHSGASPRGARRRAARP